MKILSGISRTFIPFTFLLLIIVTGVCYMDSLAFQKKSTPETIEVRGPEKMIVDRSDSNCCGDNYLLP